MTKLATLTSALTIASALFAFSPAQAQPSEPWVIDSLTGLAVPQSIERLAALKFATANPDQALAAWADVITHYQLTRAAGGSKVTLEEKAKAFQACSTTLGKVSDPVMQQCLARTGYFNFRG
jgi:hypothetical protein